MCRSDVPLCASHRSVNQARSIRRSDRRAALAASSASSATAASPSSSAAAPVEDGGGASRPAVPYRGVPGSVGVGSWWVLSSGFSPRASEVRRGGATGLTGVGLMLFVSNLLVKSATEPPPPAFLRLRHSCMDHTMESLCLARRLLWFLCSHFWLHSVQCVFHTSCGASRSTLTPQTTHTHSPPPLCTLWLESADASMVRAPAVWSAFAV